jgi:hypothetical protein
VEGSDGMLEPSVLCGGINDACHSELFDACESLHQPVVYDFEQCPMGNFDKAENGVVDDFCVVQGRFENR